MRPASTATAPVGMLELDFRVAEPPELVDHVRRVGERYLRHRGPTEPRSADGVTGAGHPPLPVGGVGTVAEQVCRSSSGGPAYQNSLSQSSSTITGSGPVGPVEQLPASLGRPVGAASQRNELTRATTVHRHGLSGRARLA